MTAANDEKGPLPTPAELEILRILWDRGPSTAREVHDEQVRERAVRYTTTLKLLQNLHDKELALRDDSRRSHVYRSAADRGEIESRIVENFVKAVFGGSAEQLVLRALSSGPATDADLEEIRRLADRLEASGE